MQLRSKIKTDAEVKRSCLQQLTKQNSDPPNASVIQTGLHLANAGYFKHFNLIFRPFQSARKSYFSC